MSIKIDIKNQLPLDVMENEIKSLDMKRSLSGHIMVLNHVDMDIVLDEKRGKITTYTKKDFGELVYKSQNRFFDFLFKKGVILPESIKGANVFGAIEGTYPSDQKIDNLIEQLKMQLQRGCDPIKSKLNNEIKDLREQLSLTTLNLEEA